MTARIIPFPAHRIVRTAPRFQGESPVARLAAVIREAVEEAEAEAAKAKRGKKKK